MITPAEALAEIRFSLEIMDDNATRYPSLAKKITRDVFIDTVREILAQIEQPARAA